jgi:hypothetical protein
MKGALRPQLAMVAYLLMVEWYSYEVDIYHEHEY